MDSNMAEPREVMINGQKKAVEQFQFGEMKKEIPAQHLKSGCRTIGCTLEDLYAWADTNC
jgi:hypothetical protein